MALTRSKRTLEDGVAKVSQKVKKAATMPSQTSVKHSSKPPKPVALLLEDSLAHIEVPKDLRLPVDFTEFHAPDFVDGLNHILKIDPTLYPVISHSNFISFENNRKKEIIAPSDRILVYWYSLISSVISQQISGSAAKSIESKFQNLFEGQKPTPVETLAKSVEELRGVGLSGQKIKYIIHISEVFSDPKANLSNVEFYSESSTETIIEELVTLKGIGEWSAKMFAVFTLHERDVFAEEDLGIARGMSRYLSRRKEMFEDAKAELNNDESKKSLLKKKSKFESKGSKRDWVPVHDEYVKYVASKFAPYRSVLMMVLWRLSSTNIEVLENSGSSRKY